MINMINPARFTEPKKFIPVDEWKPEPDDEIIKSIKGFILVPISSIYNIQDNSYFDYFKVSAKKCYNRDNVRDHIVHYLNYFLKFYDQDKELIMIYSRLKYLIDFQHEYSKDALIYDLYKYILSPSMNYKITLMNRDNYCLKLDKSYCKNNSTQAVLKYNDRHGFILYKISLIMLMFIPCLTEYISVKQIPDTDQFLIDAFGRLLTMFDVDMYSKLYETCTSNIDKRKGNHPLWEKQDIRGINPTLHALSSMRNIVLNIMPKYEYNQNAVIMNFRSILKSMGYQITNIGYEVDYQPLSSSNRDEEFNSEFDKFENTLTKEDEALYIQNKVNCEQSMKLLTIKYNISQEEVDFYVRRLSSGDEGFVINDFQKNLIFDMFYSVFGDVVSIRAINRDDYVRLMIIAKRILISNSMVILPYVISSKVIKISPKKALNKKEMERIEKSPFYPAIIRKYRTDTIKDQIQEILATILVSNFNIIEFEDKSIDGLKVEMIPEIVSEEVLQFVNRITI